MTPTNTGGFCVNCGNPMDPAAQFCVSCGNERAPAPPPATPVSPRTEPVLPPGRPTVSTPAPTVTPPPVAPPPQAAAPRDAARSPNRNRAIVSGIVLGLAIVGIAGLVRARSSHHTSAPSATAQGAGAPATASPIASTAAPSAPPASTSLSSSAPKARAIGQARALNALLMRSADARRLISDAVVDIRTCRDIEAGVQVFVTAHNARQQLLEALQRQSFTLLPDSAALQQALTTAWQNSIQADASYIAWGRDLESSGCQNATQDRNYAAALAIDANSTSAKREFVALWNPTANRYRLPQQADTSI